MSFDIRKCLFLWEKADKNRRLAIVLTAGLMVFSMFLISWDYYVSTKEISGGLKRKDYGQGTYTESLKVKGESGESTEIELEVSEKQYTEDDMKTVFDRCISQMESLILGANKSYDRIEQDMNLITELPGEQVTISWELDRYDVMDVKGNLKSDMLQAEGTLVNLSAVITYRENPEYHSVYECSVMVYPGSEDHSLAAAVQDSIQKQDKSTKEKEYLQLPKKVEEETVSYFPVMDSRGVVLLVMTVLIGILLYALEIQNREQGIKDRKQQMLVDYPEIINKLTLYLGAGMIVKRAWKKIVEDYEVQKSILGNRYAYEEMKLTCREMESGVSEAESYERFGKRCNVQEYMKLGALLSQNLRKGTKGLRQMLKLEAAQAFEERKARARRMGEEAGTKMLAPMFLMLAVVLVIVVVPAFLSIQL